MIHILNPYMKSSSRSTITNSSSLPLFSYGPKPMTSHIHTSTTQNHRRYNHNNALSTMCSALKTPSLVMMYQTLNPKLHRSRRTSKAAVHCNAAAASSFPLSTPNNNNNNETLKNVNSFFSPTSIVFYTACLATFMAASSRVCFSVLAIPIQQQYGLFHSQMGMIQSALLIGYIAGQIPAGLVADRLGGAQTLSIGIILWSIASLVMTATPYTPHPLAFMICARAALGLAQSILMPGVSAAAAQWFTQGDRGSKTSSVYAFFSLGTVVGMAATPFVAAMAGWPIAFAAFGVTGIIAGMVALKYVPKHQIHRGLAVEIASTMGEVEYQPRQNLKRPRRKKMNVSLFYNHFSSLALLCFTHAVIGFGFFILQAWIPTFLFTLKDNSLTTIGFMSALPWLVTAVVAEIAGKGAMWLQIRHDWSVLRVRRVMQVVANLGGSFCLLPLVCMSNLSPETATLVLIFAVAMQGFCYSGFHSYVGDFSPSDAGLILGFTNSCGILAGIVGNIVAGHVASTSGFRAVFGVASALYFASGVTWWLFANGQAVSLTSDSDE